MIKSFRSIALLEGISTLALYFFAMPMKYIANDPIYVKNIGMAHGILFMLYIAFAIFNKIQNKLVLVRDRAGVKPLYYYTDEKEFMFSSEIKSFHKLLSLK
jgi:integral membrane protein